MNNDPLPTFNVEAERAILGACLVSPKALKVALAKVSDEDWYHPIHQTVWTAMRALAERDIKVDAVSVAHELGSAINRIGGHVTLVNLIQASPLAVNVEYHIDLIASHAVRRRVLSVFQTQAQRISEGADAQDVIANAQIELELAAKMHRTNGPIAGLHEWHEFVEVYANKFESWVVPGFIGRKDVWMILAPPGAGKTTLSRQLCWNIAAGFHPFDRNKRIDAKRTLLIDLENDEGMAADESFQWLHEVDVNTTKAYGEVSTEGYIWSYPQGLNIRDAADANLLDQVIGDIKPQFVALGSLYKSFTRSGDWDQAAGEARAVFDRMRARHQIAFWFEHHMPKAQDGGRKHTPFGSSVWEWWASHGRVLEPAVPGHPGTPYNFKPFRGDRRKSECPVGFTKGRRNPWDPVWDEHDLKPLVDACLAK